jgi:hypothetical protein
MGVSRSKINYLILFVWAAIAFITACNHEIWRDEMRMLSTTLLHPSIFELPRDMVNEGHPMLWYVLLKFCYFIYPNPIVLKIISFLIGLASVALVLKYFRLPLYILTLFIFTNIMMFENTVMCRDYGISALLIILFFILHERGKFYWSLLIIFLLIQTQVVGSIVGVLLFGLVFVEVFEIKDIKYKKLGVIALSFLVSILLFYYTTRTNELSYFYNVNTTSMIDSLKNLFISIVYPSKVLAPFIKNADFLNSILVLILAYVLSRKIWHSILFYACAVLINVINLQVYTLSSRHIGVMIVFMFCMYARDFKFNLILKNQNWNAKILSIGNLVIIPIVFFCLVISNFVQCIEDVYYERSSSLSVANFIKSNPKYANSVLMSEPDFYLEPLPYYIPNKLFFPRENRHALYASFSKLNKDTMAMSEIIKYSDAFKMKTKAPGLILFKDFDFTDPSMRKVYFVYLNKTLTWTKQDVSRLKKLKEFNKAVGDENYSLYEIL